MTGNKKNAELTISSTYYSPESKKLLELNYGLTRKLNSGIDFTWIASDGSEQGENNKVDQNKFLLIEGVNSTGIPEILADKNLARYAVTYYHGLSLMKTIPHIKTRFVAFLDVDFFIVRPDWISEVTEYMKKENLAFFGSPFHPRFIQKYRYFPCLQFLCIDLKKVGRENVDFNPYYHEDKGLSTADKAERKVVKTVLGAERLKIGVSKDTSYRTYKNFAGNSRLRNEIIKPVFNPAGDLMEQGMDTAPSYAGSFWNRMLEKILPEKYCFIPKDKNSYEIKSFKEFGVFDAGGEGWEEYLWKSRPFGFHLRQISKRIGRGTLHIDTVESALKYFKVTYKGKKSSKIDA